MFVFHSPLQNLEFDTCFTNTHFVFFAATRWIRHPIWPHASKFIYSPVVDLVVEQNIGFKDIFKKSLNRKSRS
jgi:hypothetical protein